MTVYVFAQECMAKICISFLQYFIRHMGNPMVCLVSQSCPALSEPLDWSSPGSSVQGIFQVRILEWFEISFSRRSSRPWG